VENESLRFSGVVGKFFSVARRSKQSSFPLPLLLGLAAAGVLIFGLIFFWGGRADPYRTTDTLDPSAYLDNANSLRGNVYRLEAEILNALALSPSEGRLISIRPDSGQVLPLLVPNSLNHLNLQKGQRFIFLVEVDPRGLLQARDLTKS
jgi:hypothetical protein